MLLWGAAPRLVIFSGAAGSYLIEPQPGVFRAIVLEDSPHLLHGLWPRLV